MHVRTLVTGGAGFIGGSFIRRILSKPDHHTILCLDKLTYAGRRDSLPLDDAAHFRFVRADICDRPGVTKVLADFRPHRIVHFAAESHVDRSIDRPLDFVQTNVIGTCTLLLAAEGYWRSLKSSVQDLFRFLHVSTDEVYGSLGSTGKFSEDTAYDPRSPYSASKAASDHFARAWFHTYGLPVIVTNCSNNYGPHQFPEKLIPLMILNAIRGGPLPIYGDGKHIRDWLYVEDHCEAIERVLEGGRPGQTYNIGGNCERTNIEVVKTICKVVHELLPNLNHHCEDLITFVKDRPGHDRRYAIDATKMKHELGWTPTTKLDEGIRKTVSWYLNNPIQPQRETD
jgi:dTDP-glucose 4,6-dehydratase